MIMAFSYRFNEAGENARAGREVTNFAASPRDAVDESYLWHKARVGGSIPSASIGVLKVSVT